ncbi:MAG: hypothetical protein QM731_09430 [Chitinophagaceae bacterium]
MSFRFTFVGLLAVTTAFTSCSIYKSGQTPDDVYYSPAREVQGESYLSRDDDGNYGGDSYYTSDDNWLRMRVRNGSRWSSFYDYDMMYSSGYAPYYPMYGYNAYNPYLYGSFLGYGPSYGMGLGLGVGGSYWNNYYYWNSLYNPYCNYIIVGGGKGGNANVPLYNNTVRTLNVRSYNNATGYNNRNAQSLRSTTRPGSAYQYNNGNASGSRRVSGGRESYYTPSANDRPVRAYTPAPTYTPSSGSRTYSGGGSTGSSAGSSSSGGGSRPIRN